MRTQNNLNLNLSIHGIHASWNWKFPSTSIGAFNFDGSLTRFTKFDQFIKGGATFSVLGTTGYSISFPPIATQGRANVGWNIGLVSTDVFLNYVSSYRNYATPKVIPVVLQDGFPASGGDPVGAIRPSI